MNSTSESNSGRNSGSNLGSNLGINLGSNSGRNSGSNSGRKLGNNVHVTNASTNELPTVFTNYVNTRANIIPEKTAKQKQNNNRRKATQNAANKTAKQAAKQTAKQAAKQAENNAQRRINNQIKPKGIFGTLHKFFRSGHSRRQTRKNKAILKIRNSERKNIENINTNFISAANQIKHAEFKENPRKYIKDNYHYLNILLNNIKEYYTNRRPLPLFFIIITGYTDYAYDELNIPDKAQLWIPRNFDKKLILESIEYCEECETFLKSNLRIVR